MQRKYSSTSNHPLQDDVTANYLSYWTDNGAYYYYHTEDGLNYEDTIISTLRHAIDVDGIPYKSVQLDSWFYFRGQDNGVVEWVVSLTYVTIYM
jgi:hypothetical protein